MNIVMIGTGYVGLVSGTCFAEVGHNVTCVDIDPAKVAMLTETDEIPIYEPGLADLVQANKVAGRLGFTTNYASCVPQADAIFIAVGTPQDEDGSADLQYVQAAARDVAAHLTPEKFAVVVNKSTVPVGTQAMVRETIQAANPNAHMAVVSNPEFLREGCALEDFMKPDRIVVGVPDGETGALARNTMTALYKPFTDQGYLLMMTDPQSSELIKYAANAFLATKITFINEIAALCESLDANVQAVSEGMGLDDRIGKRFLQPGPGYGGSCFPKDTHALAKIGHDAGIPQRLVEETIATNQAIKERMVNFIEKALGGSVSGKKIGVLGVAFKAGTDDMREAPSLTILPALHTKGADLKAYDPEAMPRATDMLPQVRFMDSVAETVRNCDAAVALTEWPDFADLPWEALLPTMAGKKIIDLRNILDTTKIAENGGVVHHLGKKS